MINGRLVSDVQFSLGASTAPTRIPRTCVSTVLEDIVGMVPLIQRPRQLMNLIRLLDRRRNRVPAVEALSPLLFSLLSSVCITLGCCNKVCTESVSSCHIFFTPPSPILACLTKGTKMLAL